MRNQGSSGAIKAPGTIVRRAQHLALSVQSEQGRPNDLSLVYRYRTEIKLGNQHETTDEQQTELGKHAT